MAEEYRVTIRLTPDLYAQLEAHGSQGQPLAAIVRTALLEYLSRQPAQPQEPAELATTLAAMAARLDGLQAQVEALAARVDTLAATGQPPGSHRQPWQPHPLHRHGHRGASASSRRARCAPSGTSTCVASRCRR